MPSFGEELGRFIPHMRRFARALVRGHSRQAADDLVQETIGLAMRAERIARGPHLRSWCFSNLMRVHRHWEHTVLGGSPNRPQPSDGDGPLAFMPRDIARLDLLPLDNREVLLLTVLVGMSYAEAAETLHVTTDTVMTKLDAARSILARGHRVPTLPSADAGVGHHKASRGVQYLHVVK